MSGQEPTVQVLTPRGRGRPRVVGDGGCPVTAWVSNADADRIYALARERRCSVSEVLREMMRGRGLQKRNG